MRKRMPPAVASRSNWAERFPDPSLAQLLSRYASVDHCVRRYREARIPPRPEWLEELGVLKEKS